MFDSRKILCYEEYDTHFWSLNFQLIIVRNYIFWCAKYNFKIDINFLPKKLENEFKEQKTLAVINQTETKFSENWEVWQNLFE